MIPAYLSPLVNHLWQSTLFAAGVGLLTLALRKNRAGVRYWLWLAASVKFLIPFSLLVAIGGTFQWRTAPAIAPAGWTIAVEQVFVPPALQAAARASVPAPPTFIPAMLFAVWLAGVAGVFFSWWRQ